MPHDAIPMLWKIISEPSLTLWLTIQLSHICFAGQYLCHSDGQHNVIASMQMTCFNAIVSVCANDNCGDRMYDFQRLASFSFSLPTISTWRDVNQCSVSPPTLSLVKRVALVLRRASVYSNYPGSQIFWRSVHFCWEKMGRWQTWNIRRSVR